MAIATSEKPAFWLKADFLPMTVLKLSTTDLGAIRTEIESTSKKAPNYFSNTPVIIDAELIKNPARTLHITSICKLMRSHKMIPVALRGTDKALQKLAESEGLALINKAITPNRSDTKLETAKVEQQEAAKVEQPAQKPAPIKEAAPQKAPTKIITKPVRSGTRVYAKNGDLIIMAAVNAGGECIADGNIHVYGPLRGRALAGATGDTDARIFCRKLEAELISIAGHYQIKENIKPPKTSKPLIQIFLDKEKLNMEGI